MRLATFEKTDDLSRLGDEELVAHARAGEEQAVRAIVRRHNRQLFRIARGVVRDDAEAEDIVQETYVRAFTNLSSFRGEASFATWLTRIALNEALGRQRIRKRVSVGLTQLEPDSAADGDRVVPFPFAQPMLDPESEAGREQVRQVLERAVDALPDDFRTVFMLREIQGLSTEETGLHLSLSPATVKTRLHRARKLLRRSIERLLSGQFTDLFPFDGERCARMAESVVRRLR